MGDIQTLGNDGYWRVVWTQEVGMKLLQMDENISSHIKRLVLDLTAMMRSRDKLSMALILFHSWNSVAYYKHKNPDVSL